MNQKTVWVLIFLLLGAPRASVAQTIPEIKVDLGQTLFFDQSLSLNRNQSCATCHNPTAAFTDPRSNQVESAASMGSDLSSIGDRNAPSITYAAMSPEIHFDGTLGRFRGGQFWDGRARNLEDQAGQPIFNPKEMALPDKSILSKRIKQTDYYNENFPKAFGLAVFSDDDTLLAAVATSLAAFQKADFFSPFDSKYDSYLRGDYELTAIEESGRSIFFSSAKSNCSSCHQLEDGGHLLEPFSNFGYYNIGVPTNQHLRSKNGQYKLYRDVGLAKVSSEVNISERGRFKVPGLRNVAVTPPYMHNGVFRRLRTVLEFHDKYNNPARRVNPETQSLWLQPEVGEWRDSESLDAKALENRDIDALLAFLKLLTDQRYE